MSTTRRLAGWAAVFAGVVGVVAFGLLVAALAAPTPSATSLRRDVTLFQWQDAVVLLQALAMIPVVLGVYTLLRTQGRGPGQATVVLGLGAQALLALAILLQFAKLSSDMLYMLPQGLVGLWLVVVNWRPPPQLSKGLARTGFVAGVGLLVIGVGTLIHVILVAPKELTSLLTDAEIDAQTWTTPNVVAHICLAVGTIGRAVYPVWTLLLARNLLRQSVGAPSG